MFTLLRKLFNIIMRFNDCKQTIRGYKIIDKKIRFFVNFKIIS